MSSASSSATDAQLEQLRHLLPKLDSVTTISKNKILNDGGSVEKAFERLSKVASRIRAASRLGRAVEIHQNDQAIAERNSYIFASPDERSRSRKRWASTAGLPGGRSWGNFRAVAEMLSLRLSSRVLSVTHSRTLDVVDQTSWMADIGISPSFSGQFAF